MRDDIDKQIKDWGERTQPPPLESRRKQQILEALANTPDQQNNETAVSPVRKFPVPLAWAAALILVGVTIGVLLTRAPNGTPPPPTGDPVSGLSQTDLDEIRVVAAEIDRLFPEGVQWISKVNGKVTFEPRNKRRISTGEDKQVLISYAVLKQTDTGKWQQLSRHDIVTYANEPVEITAGDDVRIWCHLTDDGHAMIDAQINLKVARDELQLDQEHLQKIGEPVVLTEADADYRIVQSVHLL